MNNLLKNQMLWGWLGGIFCLLFFLTLIGKNIFSALGFGLAAVLLLPPLANIPSQLIKKPISSGVKIILLIVFLFLGFSNAPEYESVQTSKDIISPTKVMSTSTPAVKGVSTLQQTISPKTYKVVRVVDGDTIEVEIEGKEKRIRLIGIDTPETVDPRKTVECFGIEASNKAKKVLLNKDVVLEADPTQGERDKYNRLLRYVFLDEGINFNELMISEGFAHEYTYAIPYKYQEEFKQAEKEARENKKGLWADDVCLTPSPTPVPTRFNTQPAPTQQYIQPTSPPQPTVNNNNSNNSGFACNCSRSCSQISTCEEAYYQLNTCGCSVRDGDSDGIPCENLCQ